MSLSSTNSRKDHVGTAAVSIYSYNFRIFVDADLLVTKKPVGGVDTPLTLGVDYTVQGAGDPTGGTITLLAGNLPTGDLLTIRRVLTLVQGTDIKNQGSFFPKIHEDTWDISRMIDQQQQDDVERAMRLAETEVGSAAATTWPSVADRASKVLGFDAAGNPVSVANVPTSGVSATAYMETLLDDADAATARATLGLTGEPQVCQGRLCLATLTPVSPIDLNNITTFFFTPYKGDQISLYDGSKWNYHTLAEISLAVPATANTNFDVWVYDNAGTLTLETTDWATDSTRATALVLQDGVFCKSGDLTRRYVGTMRTRLSGKVDDNLTHRYVWNYYNRVRRALRLTISGFPSWVYSTATWRQARADANNQVNFVVGVQDIIATANSQATFTNATLATEMLSTMGFNSITNVAGDSVFGAVDIPVANNKVTASASLSSPALLGHNYISLLEFCNGGTGTWYGDDFGGVTSIKTGIVGHIQG